MERFLCISPASSNHPIPNHSFSLPLLTIVINSSSLPIKRIEINVLKRRHNILPAGKWIDIIPRRNLILEGCQLIIEPLLQLLRLKVAKSGIGTRQHIAVVIGARPHHVQLQIALRPARQVDGLARHPGQGASLGGLVDVRQLAVESIGVLRTGAGLAKDAGIVEGDAGDDAVLHIDNGREEGIDEAQILVVIPTEET